MQVESALLFGEVAVYDTNGGALSSFSAGVGAIS